MTQLPPGPRLIMVLTENWTVASPRDLRALVRLAQEAEACGIDAVMLSEHVVLGPGAGSSGRPQNPKQYAAPGNQDPRTPWPDSLVLMGAIAAATSHLRIIAAAIIAPLRHPLLLAHQLATLDLLSEGRLVVQPTVGWHRDEYDALGVPFDLRGQMLDEHLAAWELLWGESPTTYRGQHYQFEHVYLEPKPFRMDGPRLWFGGQRISRFMIRRLVRYGSGFHPFGQPAAGELEPLERAMQEAGRDFGALELVGGIRPRFLDSRKPADLAEAAASIPDQMAAGYTSICFNPSQYAADWTEMSGVCRRLVQFAAGLT